MKKVFITSFSDFGPYPANSSQQVAKCLAGRADPSFSFEFRTETLPANIPHYDRGTQMLEMAFQHRASAIISLGMSSSKKSLCVETKARNVTNHPVYCSPEENGRPVTNAHPSGATLGIDTRPWNLEAFISNCVAARLPRPEISSDAGGYCCNSMMVQVLTAKAQRPHRYWMPYIFAHLPCTREAMPLGFLKLMKSGKAKPLIQNILGNRAFLKLGSLLHRKKCVSMELNDILASLFVLLRSASLEDVPQELEALRA